MSGGGTSYWPTLLNTRHASLTMSQLDDNHYYLYIIPLTINTCICNQ